MTTEVINAFVEAIHQAGIVPLEPIEAQLASGKPIYFRADGDKKYERRGWAILHLDGRPAGAFGHFKAMLRQTWRFEEGSRLSRRAIDELAAKAREQRQQRDAEQLARQSAVAAVCRDRWNRAGKADPEHGYLVAKAITGEGLRQTGDRLLVPMHDVAGVLWNIQTIAGDGTKRFAKGALQKGLHLLVGEVQDRLAVAEGYGTAAVIRRATGLPVAVAFSASNLVTTAKAMRGRFPHADIIIGADDDAHLVNHPQIKRNLGLEAAHAAARAVCGRVAVPPRNPA